MDCTLCPRQGNALAYTVIHGRDVCMECVDLILRLFPDREPESNVIQLVTAHEHDWGQWWPVTDRDAVRQCLGKLGDEDCQAVDEAEWGKCSKCGVSCVVMPTDYGPGHTTPVPHGDWDNYDPCEDENGLPAPHTLE